jgi:hypothetical protein
VSDAVRKNNEVSRDVEKLARSKQFARKDGLQELASRASGAVKNQNGVCDAALRIAHWLAKRSVVQAQFRQRFARPEFEILDHEIALGCCGKSSLLARGSHGSEDSYRAQQDEATDYGSHQGAPLRQKI